MSRRLMRSEVEARLLRALSEAPCAVLAELMAEVYPEQLVELEKSQEWKAVCRHLMDRESQLTRKLVDSVANPDPLSGALSDAALKAQIKAYRYVQFSLIRELMDSGEEKDESKTPVV